MSCRKLQFKLFCLKKMLSVPHVGMYQSSYQSFVIGLSVYIIKIELDIPC